MNSLHELYRKECTVNYAWRKNEARIHSTRDGHGTLWYTIVFKVADNNSDGLIDLYEFSVRAVQEGLYS